MSKSKMLFTPKWLAKFKKICLRGHFEDCSQKSWVFSLRSRIFPLHCSMPHIHLWTCLPSCPLRLWFEFCVFPVGGFFDWSCLPFPLSVLPLKSLFTSSAFKERFVTDWFPSVVLGFFWPSVSTFAVSIASLVGAYRLNHCCKGRLSN